MAAPDSTPKRLVIASPKGGVAKTTTARNIAVAAACDGLSVATVDLDPQQSLTVWFERRPEEAMKISHFTAAMGDVESIIDLAGFDLIVVDTPPLVTDGANASEIRGGERLLHLRRLLDVADFVLAPTLQQDEDVTSTENWMQTLGVLGVKSASLLSATTRRTLSYEDARRRLNRVGALCPVDVPRFEDVPSSNRQGLGVVEIRKAKGADDFIAVWHFVRQQLKMLPVMGA